MIILQSELLGKWQTQVGLDGYIHVMPVSEDHEAHHGCACNPMQKIYAAGGSIFTHRVLTC